MTSRRDRTTTGRRIVEGGALLETPRLVLRPVDASDVPELHRIFLEPEVRRYLLDDVRVPRTWVEEEVRGSRERFERDGCGLWAIRMRGAAPILGFAGYRPFFDPPRMQLLYGLHPSFWGEGFATEAASAVIRFAFEHLEIDAVRAATDRPNRASIAVLERLGMRLERESVESGRETLFYVLQRIAADPDPDGSGATTT